jgi:hypothetical protein
MVRILSEMRQRRFCRIAQRCPVVVAQFLAGFNSVNQVANTILQTVDDGFFRGRDSIHRQIVEQTFAGRQQNRDLLGDLERTVLLLLQNLTNATPVLE